VWIVAYPSRDVQHWSGNARQGRRLESADGCEVADADGWGCDWERESEWDDQSSARGDLADRCGLDGWIFNAAPRGVWEPEPDVGRVAHGVPNRVDRLRGLGNAIVPPIAEWIARRILAAEGLTATSQATSATQKEEG